MRCFDSDDGLNCNDYASIVDDRVSPPPCGDGMILLVTLERGRLAVLRCRWTGWGVLLSITWSGVFLPQKCEVAKGTKWPKKFEDTHIKFNVPIIKIFDLLAISMYVLLPQKHFVVLLIPTVSTSHFSAHIF